MFNPELTALLINLFIVNVVGIITSFILVRWIGPKFNLAYLLAAIVVIATLALNIVMALAALSV